MKNCLFASFIIGCIGCGQADFQRKKETVFELPGTTEKVTNFDFKRIEGKEYFSFVNQEQKQIGLLPLNNSLPTIAIPLDTLNAIQDIKQGLNYFVHNYDSIFVLLKGTTTVYLINAKGLIARKWNIQTTLSNHNTNFVFESLPQIPLYYQDKRIYVLNTRMDIMVNNPAGRHTYFNSIPELIIDLSTYPESIINKTGKWPLKYTENGSDYDDYWPSRCVNENGEIIYGFSITPEIDVYRNDSLYKKIVAASPYVNGIHPYPPDSIWDIAFKKKYWVTESRYGKIIYDMYFKKYYRVILHGIEYENTDGYTVNNIEDKPWSLQIFDSQLNLKKEILFDPREYSPFYIFPTPEGVWISKRTKKGEKINTKRFSLIEFSV